MTGIAAGDDGARYELVTEAGTDHPSESPILWLRRLLRGRYRLAIGLAALVGCVGAVTGFLAMPAKYESQGLVRIEKALPAILYPTQEGQAWPDFDAYVAAQAAHLQSRSVVEAAAGSPAMQQAGWPAGAAGIASLHRALEVRRPRGEHFLFVTVTHTNPRLAHVAVNAVLDAYRDRPREAEGLTFAAREQALMLREESLHEALFLLRTQILEASGQYGREAIDRMHAAKVEELIEIDRKLAAVRMERQRLLAGEGAALVGPEIFPTGTDRLSVLKERELALLAEIKGSRYRPGHPVIQELARKLQTVRIQMDLYGRAGGAPAPEGDQAGAGSTALEDLARLEASYEAVRAPIRQEAEELGRLRVTLAGLGEHEAQLKERLNLARQRLDEIRFEARRGNTDRISIAWGELPVAPVSDRRRGLAAAGLLLGVLGGVGIVVLIGLADPRVRYADELEAMNLRAPVAAVVPQLCGSDEARERSAVRGIQQLRSTLELASRDPARIVHAITSADHGEGRTDLAHALATCFAAAGRRTLVIDADFAGPRLTAELELQGRPGLCEALAAGDHDDRIHRTDQANLWGMPVGSTQVLNPRDLSPDGLGRLLDTLRGRFDAIVIDTPPVLAAAEASLVSTLSDSVVLVAARNRRRDLIRAGAARLHQVGAELIGLVFNMAAASDTTHQYAGVPAAWPPVAPAVTASSGDDSGPIARLPDEQPAADTSTMHERKRAA